MKKKFFLFTLFGAGVLTLASCGGVQEVGFAHPLDGGEPQADWTEYSTPISDIRISSLDREIILDNIGKTDTVEYSISPRTALKTAVDWVSSDESIATVSKNLSGEVTVTAVGGGECSVTASSGAVSDTIHIIVNVPIEDFSLSTESIDLDYGESVEIIPTFTPSYTTFKDLSWTASDDSIVVVDGRVTAGFQTVTNGTISVTSSQLNKVVVVHVNVTDKWNYVETVNLTSSATELEIDHSLDLASTVTAVDHEHPASTLTKNAVRYVSLTPDILRVDEETGEVTAIGTGEGRVKASLFDERSGVSVSSNEIEIEAYEVRATDISIKTYSKQTVALDNVDNPTITLEPQYTLNDLRADRPSRGDISFSSNDEEVVKVSEQGVVSVVGKGSATITMTDSYSNIADYVNINVTIHGTNISLASSATEAGVNRPITLSTTIAPKGVSDPSVTFEAIPSANVTIENNGDGTASAMSSEEGLVQFVAYNGTGDHRIVSNIAPVNFKYLFEENVLYVVGSKNFSGHGAEGDSWNNAGKAAVLLKTEDTPEGYSAQYKARLNLSEGDQFKFRNGEIWLDTISWIDPGDEQPHIRVDHVEDAGAIAAGKMHINESSSDYGNIVVDVDGVYDIYYKAKTDGYDIYIGDAPVFRFEIAPKTVEYNKSVEVKVSDWKEDVTVTKNNDNISMTAIDKTTGKFTITGLVVGETTILSATDAEKTISYEVKVINQIAEFTLAGTFNNWAADDQSYGLQKVSEHHYVIENVSFAIGTELQAVSRVSGDYFGNVSEPENCHYTLADDGFGKKKLVVNLTGTYNVHIYTNGTSDPIVLKLVEEDDPIIVYDYDWYLNLNNSLDATTGDMGTSRHFEVDPNDSNIYWVKNLTLSLGDRLKAYSPVLKQWRGTTAPGDYWTVDNGDIVVSVAGTYDLKLFINYEEGNHIYLISEKDDWGTGAALVGSRNYSGSGAEGASWNDATKAYMFTTEGGDVPAGVAKQYYAKIDFEEDDEFRFRIAGDYPDETGSNIVEAGEGSAYTKGQITKSGDNYIIKKTGSYDVYVKHYSDGHWGVWIGEIPGSDPEPTTVKTFYFACPTSWTDLHVYYFGSSGAVETWPGVGMEPAGGPNQYGEYIYSITFDTAVYTTVIFNSPAQGAQTRNIAVSEFGTNNACSLDGSTVVFWTK